MSGLEAILLLGSLHGVVLAAVLLRRARNRRANRFLAVLLGATSLLLLDAFFAAHGTLGAHPHLIGITAWLPFLLGPLVYLYVREMTVGERPWRRHFVVTAAFIAVLVVSFYPRSAEYKLQVMAGVDLPLPVAISQVFVVVYGLAYSVAAIVLLQRHRTQVQAVYSNLGGVSLRWLFVLVVLDALVWMAAIVVFVMQVIGDNSAGGVLVPLGSTLTIFVIGYFQLGQVEIIHASVVAVEPPIESSAPAPAYQKARLPEDDAAELAGKIEKAMTADKLYQRGGLTLGDLADAVGATPHEVSQVLSTRFGKNFYTYVNEHRVDHVKAALATSERPVLDLALEAGFQSKSTFNAAFRKATGKTPSEFRTEKGPSDFRTPN